MTAFAP